MRVDSRQALKETGGAPDLPELDAMADAVALGEGSEQEHDLLECRVARPFTEPAHRHLDVGGPRPDRSQGIRRSEPQVVVAVNADHGSMRAPLC